MVLTSPEINETACFLDCLAPQLGNPRAFARQLTPLRINGRRRRFLLRSAAVPEHPFRPAVADTAGERGVFGGSLLVEKDDGSGGLERSYNPEMAKLFLREYWQRRPVLFRNALKSFASPLSPDELAGLACEQDVESRIIIHWGGGGLHHQRSRERRPDWELRLGPFVEADFEDLPERNYTLLVQEVNAFLPNWRLDDVMVSYATEGGGVGPHVDSYDVFLLQTAGRRRWSTSYTPIQPDAERLVEDIDVRVLDGGFHIDAEWVLEPGDMLYVPPRFPHWGVSLDDSCMTFSVGMRSPEKRELVRSFADFVISNRINASEGFLTDSSHDLCDHTVGGSDGLAADPGIISPRAVSAAHQSLHDILSLSEHEFARWYAKFVTLPKRNYPGRSSEEVDSDSLVAESEAEGIIAEIAAGAGVSLRHREATVFSYLSAAAAGCDGDVLYVNGESFPLLESSHGAAKLLCSRKVLEGSILQRQLNGDPPFGKLLATLIRRGLLYCVYEDDA